MRKEGEKGGTNTCLGMDGGLVCIGLQVLTVHPVVVVGFSADVMLTAAMNRRTEDGSVGSHEIY